MKIRVHSSDGVYVGGLFKTDCFNANSCRFWPGRPHPDYAESLIDIAGKSNPCYDSSWIRLQIATVPDISSAPDGSDAFDANSRAIRITLAEAHQWLLNHGFPPPEDLVALLNLRDSPKALRTRGTPETSAVLSRAPIPDSARQVWDALHGAVMTAKELARKLKAPEDAMRKRVDTLRKLGYQVLNQRGAGYYRPDAMPPSMSATGDLPESD